ncbi:MAG: hypothetical protein QOC81_4068 [Thermoanaerobaculia bacterium]|jgi:hypothetical protein|nr:hypothetical protein [Thermoanaerobaculia bacterium]
MPDNTTAAYLSRDEQTRLRQVLLGDTASAPRQQALLAFLFDRLLNEEVDELSAAAVMKRYSNAPTSKGGLGSLKHLLNSKLAKFFDEHAQDQPWRMSISDGYLFHVEPNNPVPPTDLVARFWSPYIGSAQPIRLFYPEPQFFKDRKETYLRNSAAVKAESARVFKYLGFDGRSDLKPVYSFVPAGVVRAMLYLLECFQRYDIRFLSRVIRPSGADETDQGHMLILGTPSTNPLIATLETRLRARSDSRGIVIDSGSTRERILPDDNQEDLTGVKWALLTRRVHRFTGRLTTILSAKHGRTVEALAGFLVNHDSLKELAEYLGVENGAFPEELQMIFKVHMSETGSEPYIDDIQCSERITQNGSK